MLTNIVKSNKLIYLCIIIIVIYFILNIKILNSFEKKRGTKFILFWNSFFQDSDYKFGFGKDPFFSCNIYDCYTMIDRDLIPIDQYDAIVFHGPEYNPISQKDHPSKRSDHQIYVYLSLESPQNGPVKSSLNGYFNYTMTHRLDSDIVLSYYAIFDYGGNYTAPQDNPNWTVPNFSNLEKYNEINKQKKLPVAWFVSNCGSQNKREMYVKELQKYIKVDIYGSCGPLNCPRSNERHCFDLLNTYYFYLSFENSNCKDYVTEKISNALANNVVPIVLGGANYTKFLPPHSYIKASGTSPKDLAYTLQLLINSPESYAKYFWWNNYYRVFANIQTYPAFCKLCEMLHNRNKPKKYYNISEWWHGNISNQMCR